MDRHPRLSGRLGSRGAGAVLQINFLEGIADVPDALQFAAGQAVNCNGIENGGVINANPL